MKTVNGYDNEYEFVKYLNGKKVSDLNPLFGDFIGELFKIKESNDIITCWRNHYPQKSDIFIKINGKIKGVSIKMGSRNSLHVERISDFIHFLIENGVGRELIISYLKYHYADGSTNGKGDFRMTVEEYKLNNQGSIDLINKAFNEEKILTKAIDRFVLRGNNSKYLIDAIIYGEVNDFLWIMRDDIKKAIMDKNEYSTAVHFGKMTCQPKNRCLNYNPKYEKDRFCVQIKWYSLFDDIIRNMNDKVGIKNNYL